MHCNGNKQFKRENIKGEKKEKIKNGGRGGGGGGGGGVKNLATNVKRREQ